MIKNLDIKQWQGLPPESFLQEPYEALTPDFPEVVRWIIGQSILNILEVPTDYVKTILPNRFRPVEVRPGTSLIVQACHIMLTGNTDVPVETSPFYENLLLVVIMPDLSINMPMPKFCFYIVNIATNSKAFVQNEGENLLLSVSLDKSLSLTAPSKYELVFKDNEGDIMTLKSTYTRNIPPVMTPIEHWFQFYTEHKEEIFLGVASYNGYAIEHQHSGNWGAVNGKHSFFSRLPDLENNIQGLYLQMFSGPLNEQLAIQRFWGMKNVTSLLRPRKYA